MAEKKEVESVISGAHEEGGYDVVLLLKDIDRALWEIRDSVVALQGGPHVQPFAPDGLGLDMGKVAERLAESAWESTDQPTPAPDNEPRPADRPHAYPGKSEGPLLAYERFPVMGFAKARKMIRDRRERTGETFREIATLWAHHPAWGGRRPLGRRSAAAIAGDGVELYGWVYHTARGQWVRVAKESKLAAVIEILTEWESARGPINKET